MSFLRTFFTPLTTAHRLVLTVLLAALAGLGLLWPLLAPHPTASGSGVDELSRITDYAATYRVGADGRVDATETLTVALPPGRHGIFRFLPVADPTDPHARRIPELLDVTLDGHGVPWDTEWRDLRSIYVIRVGDPDQTVPPGEHSYTLHYTFDGGLVPAPDAPGAFTTEAGEPDSAAAVAFYFDVVGFWMMPIDASRVSIELPGPSALVQCAADTTGQIPCEITGAGTDHVTVRTGPLPAQNPVTVRADLVAELPQRALTLPWPIRYDMILGRSAPTAGVVALLTLLGALVGWLWARRSREEPPGAPVCYAPPDGLGPVQTAYIVDERPGEHALEATVLHLAGRGLVELHRAGKKDWTITGRGGDWSTVDPATRAVGAALGVDTDGAKLHIAGGQQAGETLLDAKKKLAEQCRSWSRTEKLMVSAWSESTGRALVVVSLVVAVLGFSGLVATMWGLPFAAFTLGGLGLLSSGVGSRRTRAGRAVWSKAAGFRRLLATPSAEDRFDFAARQDLFLAYVPYAVAFGVAEAWAEKYRAATGAEPPTPDWYPVTAGGGRPSGLYAAGGLAGFSTAVAASIGAYHAAQSASSGGGSSFGSGGGSWGGGGGGGGGTW